ncbi:MAG TPA: hypothetical protein VGX23_22105 [Actinocrinis sp.]|nr:hypothetical protein [Actinocrinis sp.]
MGARRTVHLTTAVALAASLTGWGTSASASAASAAAPATGFSCSAEGYGSSLAAAEKDAESTLKGDYTILGPYTLDSDGQFSDGSWWALVETKCGNPR